MANKLFDEVAGSELMYKVFCKLSSPSALYERATTTIMADSALLTFAYADYEEQRMRFKKTEEVYKRFIANPAVDPTLVRLYFLMTSLMPMRHPTGLHSVYEVCTTNRWHQTVASHIQTGERGPAHTISRVCGGGDDRVLLFEGESFLVFVWFKSILQDSNIALNIFNLGMKKYSDEVGYAKAYLEFVMQLNDDANTRVLFEKILNSGNLPADKSVYVVLSGSS